MQSGTQEPNELKVVVFTFANLTMSPLELKQPTPDGVLGFGTSDGHGVGLGFVAAGSAKAFVAAKMADAMMNVGFIVDVMCGLEDKAKVSTAVSSDGLVSNRVNGLEAMSSIGSNRVGGQDS